jgi:hypothetical protein
MATDPNYQARWHTREAVPQEHAADADHLVEGTTPGLEHARTA